MEGFLGSVPSLINTAKEIAREEIAGDEAFLWELGIFFELRIAEGPSAGTYLYPLVVPPKEMSIEEEALVTITDAVSGGVVVEENGVNKAPIRLSGNFGWAPKAHKIPGNWERAIAGVDKRNTSRRITWSALELSGQRHLEYLHDAVFGTYWDMKNDPDRSDGVSLIYHCPKDGEHSLVIPRRFRTSRSVSENAIGSPDWEAELTRIAPAEAVDVDFSPDKGWLDSFKDTISRIKGGIGLIEGGLADINSFIGEIRAFAAEIDSIVRDITGLADEVISTIENGSALVGSIISRARTVAADCETFAERLEEQDLFRHVRAALMDCADGADAIGMYPPQIETLVQTVSPPTGTETSAAGGGPTGNLPGDRLRAQARRGDTQAAEVYPSITAHTLSETDTLESLAARYLGDPGLWDRIAKLNGLRPPYLSASGFPGTVGPNARIMIPARRRPPSQDPLAVVVRPESTDALEARLLGTDIALEVLPGGLYGVVLNENGDDFKLVRGRACFVQGLRFRVLTTQGSDELYPQLGRREVVAIRSAAANEAMAQLRLAETLRADPRVQTVRRILKHGAARTADTMEALLEVIPRGIGGRVVVPTGALNNVPQAA